MAAILNFPRGRKNWNNLFQSYVVNRKSQLFKIYMKQPQNMYLLYHSVYYISCKPCNKGFHSLWTVLTSITKWFSLSPNGPSLLEYFCCVSLARDEQKNAKCWHNIKHTVS